MHEMIPFYIGVIQMSLFLLTCLIFWCELIPVFANTLKSVLIRFSIAMSLITIGCYAHLLANAPFALIMAFFILSISSTFYTFKYIISDYNLRKTKQYSKEVINEQGF